jgi:DNA-binding response OmpR family regulator
MPRTILVADDSKTIRKIVELTFSESEIHVEPAESGAEALAVLERSRPDLVLADVVMPDPDGYEICRRVKSSSRPVPVLLLTGTFEPFDAERARECRADGHLVKPFESRVLRERVERLLSEAPADAAPAVEPERDDPESTPAGPVGEADERTATAVPVAGAAPAPDPRWVDEVARAVVERLSDRVIREIAWEVVPDVAARIIRERIRELENEDTEGS